MRDNKRKEVDKMVEETYKICGIPKFLFTPEVKKQTIPWYIWVLLGVLLGVSIFGFLFFAIFICMRNGKKIIENFWGIFCILVTIIKKIVTIENLNYRHGDYF